MPTDEVTETFVHEWFELLSAHAPIAALLPFIATENLEMEFPERTLRSHADVRDWYVTVGNSYRNQEHIVEKVDATPSAGGTDLDITVVWKAEQTSDGARLAFRVSQNWHVADSGPRPLIVRYHVLALQDM